MPRCAVSIDVDPVPCYYRIHALGPAPAHLRHVIMHRCIPRFLDIFERRGLRATFFLVASDIDSEAGESSGAERRADTEHTRAIVRALVERGHEIGNHSYSHPYELARLPRARAVDEIGRAHELLQAISGGRVCGFRAPGYDLSGTMLEELCRLGYRYDSSIFPAPGYYAAKATVMAGLAALGRPSGAVMTDPRALVAPTVPYRPDLAAPWRRGQAPVVELPVAVTRFARIPAIGTSLLLAPGWARRALLAAMRRRPFFNFELHGIDLADARADGLPAELCARQPDLRVPLADKQARFEAILDTLARDFEPVLLRDQAASTQRTV